MLYGNNKFTFNRPPALSMFTTAAKRGIPFLRDIGIQKIYFDDARLEIDVLEAAIQLRHLRLKHGCRRDEPFDWAVRNFMSRVILPLYSCKPTCVCPGFCTCVTPAERERLVKMVKLDMSDSHLPANDQVNGRVLGPEVDVGKLREAVLQAWANQIKEEEDKLVARRNARAHRWYHED